MLRLLLITSCVFLDSSLSSYLPCFSHAACVILCVCLLSLVLSCFCSAVRVRLRVFTCVSDRLKISRLCISMELSTVPVCALASVCGASVGTSSSLCALSIRRPPAPVRAPPSVKLLACNSRDLAYRTCVSCGTCRLSMPTVTFPSCLPACLPVCLPASTASTVRWSMKQVTSHLPAVSVIRACVCVHS